MSAFIVSKAHIDALVRTALHGPMGVGRAGGWEPLVYYVPLEQGTMVKRDVRFDADEIGRMLWQANYDSVAYRYGHKTVEERDAAFIVTQDWINNYTADVRWPVYPRQLLTHAAALKALECYVYQSSERDDWDKSEAAQFCRHLQTWLIQTLPGYDAAPWEINDE